MTNSVPEISGPGRSKRPMLLMLALAVAAVVAIFGANNWKRGLKVGEIRVEGNNVVSSPEILAMVNISPGEKLFEVDLYAAQKRIMQNPFMKDVSVTRHVPGILTIDIQERKAVAAVILNDVLYLDAEGVVLPPSRSEQLFDLPVVTGTLNADAFSPGKRVAAANVLEALSILGTAHALGTEIFVRISEVHLQGNSDIVLYSSEYGIPIIFGHGDAAPKLMKLDAFWKEFASRRGAHELQYVDLRFHDQVVVKWKNDKNELSRTAARPGGRVRGISAVLG